MSLLLWLITIQATRRCLYQPPKRATFLKNVGAVVPPIARARAALTRPLKHRLGRVAWCFEAWSSKRQKPLPIERHDRSPVDVGYDRGVATDGVMTAQ